LREVDSILHDLITQLVSVSIPIDKMHREEHIKNLTPITNVSDVASALYKPEGTFILGKLKPKDAKTTIFDDLMKPVTCMELYPIYIKLPKEDFILRLNKTLYDYVRRQLEQAKANDVPAKKNIWMQPNTEFFNHFQEQGINIDSIPSFFDMRKSDDKDKKNAKQRFSKKQYFEFFKKVESDSYTPNKYTKQDNLILKGSSYREYKRKYIRMRRFDDSVSEACKMLLDEKRMDEIELLEILKPPSKYYAQALLERVIYHINNSKGDHFRKTHKLLVKEGAKKNKIFVVDRKD